MNESEEDKISTIVQRWKEPISSGYSVQPLIDELQHAVRAAESAARAEGKAEGYTDGLREGQERMRERAVNATCNAPYPQGGVCSMAKEQKNICISVIRALEVEDE